MSVERCRAGILIAKVQQTKLRTKLFQVDFKSCQEILHARLRALAFTHSIWWFMCIIAQSFAQEPEVSHFFTIFAIVKE